MPLFAALACALVVTVLIVAGRTAGLFRTGRNFEGRTVAVAGLALVAGVLLGLVLRVYDGAPGAAAALAAAAGFGAVGALDDRYGDRSVSGFRGHLRAAARGRFTTGFWKVAGGGLTALLAAWLAVRPEGAGGGVLWLLRAAVIALAANAWNLLDTRPVRAVAAFVALSAPLALVLHASSLWVAVAGALAFLPWDRRRAVMLGDAGSNALGALWGVALAVHAGPAALMAALILMAGLNAYAERHSLNARIAAHPWLSALDTALRGEAPPKTAQERGEER